MKFEEITMKEALKYITQKEYLKIYEKRATYENKFGFWILLVEDGKIDPLATPLTKFYES